MQNQNTVSHTTEQFLAELKEAEADQLDLLIKISEELSRVSSTSNQDNIEPLFSLIEKETKDLPSYTEKGFSILNLGIARFYKTYFTEAIGILEPLANGDYPDIVKGAANMVLGAALRSSGRIDKAVKQLTKAEVQLRGSNYFVVIHSYVYYQLAEIHLAMSEFSSAEQYYHKALKIIEGHPDGTSTDFRCNNGLGNCMYKMNKVPEAFEYLIKALDVPKISYAERSRGLCDLGKLHVQVGDSERAILKLQESLDLRKNGGLADASSTSMIELSIAHLNLGNYEQARDLLLEAKEIAIKYNSTGKLVRTWQGLAKAYTGLNAYEEATNSWKEFFTLNDEVISKREKSILKMKNDEISAQKIVVEEKNDLLSKTIDELAMVKRSRKSWIFSISTAIVLVLLTEVFLDPFIEEHSYNEFLSLAAKVLIALLLKPMETVYERILYKKALSATAG